MIPLRMQSYHSACRPVAVAAVAMASILAVLPACGTGAGMRAYATKRIHAPAALRSFELYGPAMERGDHAEAERQLRDAIAADRGYVRAWRKLQDLQILTFRRDEAIAEAEAEVRNHPADPRSYYLLARVRAGAARRGLIETALRLDPHHGWSRLAMASAEEDQYGPGAGYSYAREAFELLPSEPDVVFSYIHFARRRETPERIEKLLIEAVRTHGGSDPRFGEIFARALSANRGKLTLGTLQSEFGMDGMLPRMLSNPNACRELAGAVATGGTRHNALFISEELERNRIRMSGASPGQAVVDVMAAQSELAAELALALGDSAAHHRELEIAYKLGERSRRLVHLLKMARARSLDLEGAVAIEEEQLADYAGAPGLDAGGTFANLKNAARNAQMSRDASALAEFAACAAQHGWIEVASEVANQADLIQPGVSARGFDLEVIVTFRRFLQQSRIWLESASRAALTIKAGLEPLRAISVKTLGRDEVGASKIEDHFPFGALLVTKPGSPGLPALFDSFGLDLRLGKRTFGPIEAFAIRRAAVRTVNGTVLGRPYEGREVVGEGLGLFTEIESSGGPFAGATLPGSVIVVLDVVDQAANSYDSEREAMVRDLAAGIGDRWKQQDLPVAADRDARLATDETFDLMRRLVRRAIERDPSPLGPRLLQMVRLHEYGHLADATQLLPFLTQLPRAIGWLLDGGFSIRAIEARLERRAELTAMAEGDDPELSLAAVAQHCEQPLHAPPHSAGFAALAADFSKVMEDESRKGRLPSIDRTRPLFPQAWKLSREEIRSIARTLAQREGLVGGP